jgi:hypothetical protein
MKILEELLINNEGLIGSLVTLLGGILGVFLGYFITTI